MVEVMKIMAATFKRTCACTATLSAPNPATGHCRPMPLPNTPEPSQASLGQSHLGSLLLCPGSWCTQGFVCVLQESVSPVRCKFWWPHGGVNGDLLPRGLMPHPGLLHPEHLSLRHATADPSLCRGHSNNQRQIWLSLCGVS